MPEAFVVLVILLPRSPSAVTIAISIGLSVTIPMPAGRGLHQPNNRKLCWLKPVCKAMC